ncbi:MAG: leucyl aminopeptidase [Zetaproteobacteria bacterium]|nr:leucyl aminopeptidase [Zetaproteobacteria bacterium]
MMKVELATGVSHAQMVDVLVLPIVAGNKLTLSGRDAQKKAKKSMDGFIQSCASLGEFGGMHTLYHVDGIKATRILFVDGGDEKGLTLHSLRILSAKALRQLQGTGVQSASVYLSELNVRGASMAEKIQVVTEGALMGAYTFDKYKKRPEKVKSEVQSWQVMIGAKDDQEAAAQAVMRGQAIAMGTNFARDLANEPGNVCTPEFLGQQAESLQHEKLKVTVMDQKAIEEAGFTALLAVNQGSDKEARFIVMGYCGGAEDEAPVALVGKGLTFDAGGICIKPAAAMDEMKFDMCGAATVLGVFKAVTEMNLPINLLGVIASTENLLGGSAYKPGDVIRAYNGTTIEVINTDAEGRIILSDALAYAAEQKPAEIIDFATLTGACVIALGSQASGLLGSSKKVKDGLKKSGDYTHDRVWELPLFDEYQEQIKSEIADLKNVGGREAGTITAACFLSHFVGDTPWAHLDIAGTAWNMKGSDLAAKGATGAGVRLISDYLIRKAKQ